MSRKTGWRPVTVSALILIPSTLVVATPHSLQLQFASSQPIASHSAAEDVLKNIPDKLQPIKVVDALPPAVRDALVLLFHQKSLQMANAGGRFNATDFVDKRYPMRRLIFAAVTGDKCLVHYERGGWSHNYYALIFRIDKHQNANLIWSASYRAAAKDISGLKTGPHFDVPESNL